MIMLIKMNIFMVFSLLLLMTIMMSSCSSHDDRVGAGRVLLLSSSSSSDSSKNDIDDTSNYSSSEERYAVIFDGGSTGSRVHVFRFDDNLDLIKIGQDWEYYQSIKPGLSSYENDPEAAATSLEPLLQNAQDVVPQQLRSVTPIRLGATAGLRLLEGDASDKILEAVRNLIKTKSSFQYKAEWISLLEGSDEGAYMWVAINYLLGKLGKEYSNTVATIDLGGGSVQMAYAISDEATANGPSSEYVQDKNLMGTNYNLYVHSYLNYGLMAARAHILKVSNNKTNPCVLRGYDGTYTYNGDTYKASANPFGPNVRKCSELIRREVLKVNALCNYKDCTFDGVWNGGGGDGTNTLYVASYFYDIAAEVGIVDQGVSSAISRPKSFMNAAKLACATKYDNAKSTFPNAWDSDLQFLCMDLLYEYTLLVDGFGLHPLQEITIVTQVQYKDSFIGAAWPLGSAIDAVSTVSTASSSSSSSSSSKRTTITSQLANKKIRKFGYRSNLDGAHILHH